MANTKISAFTAETDVANITGFAAFKTVGGSSTNVKISGSEIESTLNLSNFAVGTLAVGRGGTGATTFTANGILIGNTASAISATAELADGQLLIGSAGNAPTPATLTAGTGVTVTNGAGSITITNSAPDQTVALNAGTGITTSGTYPNFTITNSAPDQTVALTGGTGITTSGTYPNFTITNDSPNQATPAAGSSGQLQYNNGSNVFAASANLTYATDTLTVQDNIVIKGDGSSEASKLRFNCWNNNHYVDVIGPDHGNSPLSYSITLPNKIATQSAVSGGRVLEVNASGVGNWIDTPTDANTNIANTNLNLDASRTLGLGADQNLTLTGTGTSKVTFSNLGGVEIARDLTVQKNVIIQGQGYSELNAMTANTFAPDWNNGNVQSVTLTQASTFAPTNPKAGATYILIVTNTNAAITWGSYIKWAAPDTQAAPPELSGSGKTDVITLICYDGSTTNGLYYGSITKDLS